MTDPKSVREEIEAIASDWKREHADQQRDVTVEMVIFMSLHTLALRLAEQVERLEAELMKIHGEHAALACDGIKVIQPLIEKAEAERDEARRERDAARKAACPSCSGTFAFCDEHRPDRLHEPVKP